MPDTDPMRVTVLVNGQREEVCTERDTALLYVDRELAEAELAPASASARLG